MSRRVKLLIDECLHTSLVKVATDRLYEAYHVAHLGMGGLKDHELMLRIRDEDFTLVTNTPLISGGCSGRRTFTPAYSLSFLT